MEFGKVADVSKVNWKLPEDDLKRLSSLKSDHELKIFLGSPAWAVKHWKGKIYPSDCGPEKFLYHYSRNFDCIELNTTHYRIPHSDLVRQWRTEVPEHFQFCSKIPQSISHSRQGLVDAGLLRQWNGYLEDLGANAGPCFIQFHELFSYSEKYLLFKFLENWPEEYELTLEFRHPSWFKENKILPALSDYLHKKGMGLVITDVAGRRDVLHSTVTSDWTMIRLIGNNLHASDEQRLNDWGQRLSDWRQKGPRRVYFFLHQPEDNWTVEFAKMASEIFQQMEFKELPTFVMETPKDLLSVI